ncbi:hypothetical protein [Kiloniella sp. EL199]|uniref:hypothetical protein n=1 Tax=Kiloniella sp. EL199 TaxID=2107581 RepID=UPI000EA38151|nr:hypothetical protein [Kiloniella sp. EL199]
MSITKCNALIKNLFPALMLFLVSSIYFGYLYLHPTDNVKQLAVLFPPQQSFEETLKALDVVDARLVRIGYWDNLLIVDLGETIPLSSVKIPSALLLLDSVTTGGCFFTRT